MTLDELSIGDRVWHKHLHSEIMVQAIHPSDDPDREFVEATPYPLTRPEVPMKTHPSMLSPEPKPPRKNKRKATA